MIIGTQLFLAGFVAELVSRSAKAEMIVIEEISSEWQQPPLKTIDSHFDKLNNHRSKCNLLYINVSFPKSVNPCYQCSLLKS